MDKKPLSLYLHIPFCEKKCDYCDFLSFPASDGTKAAYFNALQNELCAAAKTYGVKADVPLYEIATVYFGGGTPSVADTDAIGGIFETLHTCFDVAKDAEISIEVNPGTVDEEKLRRYRDFGINRLSIGCQSMHDEELKRLGRIHTKEDILNIFHAARACGFDNINVDLMAALPDQSFDDYRDSVAQVVALQPEHISAYSLIIEEGTPFYEEYSEEVLDEDLDREMYEETDRFLSAHGFHRYEISNYARAACYECRHNVVYWLRGDYLGIGLGASSLIDNVRFHNTAEMETYIASDGNLSTIREDIEILNIHAQMEEYMFLGLRLTKGISMKAFEETFHHPIRRIYAKAIDNLLEDGLIVCEEDTLRLTPLGLDVSNYALAQFLFDE